MTIGKGDSTLSEIGIRIQNPARSHRQLTFGTLSNDFENQIMTWKRSS